MCNKGMFKSTAALSTLHIFFFHFFLSACLPSSSCSSPPYLYFSFSISTSTYFSIYSTCIWYFCHILMSLSILPISPFLLFTIILSLSLSLFFFFSLHSLSYHAFVLISLYPSISFFYSPALSVLISCPPSVFNFFASFLYLNVFYLFSVSLLSLTLSLSPCLFSF